MRELIERLRLKTKYRECFVEDYGKEVIVDPKDLPSSLQKALKKVGYRRRDVKVVPATSASVRSTAGKGSRGFALAINVATGQTSPIAMGSWGGQNPFEKHVVDWDDKPVSIPRNGAILVGSEGYKGVFVTIYVHPNMLASLLPGETDVTDRESEILRMATYKSFYKKELFDRHMVAKEELLSLVRRGYMKMNKAGATTVTPSGKNAMSKKFY